MRECAGMSLEQLARASVLESPEGVTLRLAETRLQRSTAPGAEPNEPADWLG